MGILNFIIGSICMILIFGILALFFWGIPLMIALSLKK